jgi:hypothetical protein
VGLFTVEFELGPETRGMIERVAQQVCAMVERTAPKLAAEVELGAKTRKAIADLGIDSKGSKTRDAIQGVLRKGASNG